MRKYRALDHINHQYEQILRERMQPMKDAEKVRCLIKFIKLESKVNPAYLIKTRVQIYDHLMRIAEKISYEGLKDITGDED